MRRICSPSNIPGMSERLVSATCFNQIKLHVVLIGSPFTGMIFQFIVLEARS